MMWRKEGNLRTLNKYLKFYRNPKYGILESGIVEYYYKQLVPRMMVKNCLLIIGDEGVTYNNVFSHKIQDCFPVRIFILLRSWSDLGTEVKMRLFVIS